MMENCTVLLALYIESDDRMANATRTLKYLSENLTGIKIIIIEVNRPKLRVLVEYLNEMYGGRIDYEFIADPNPMFHRTRYLNIGLRKVSTKVVIVHDIDCVLPLNSYMEAERMISEEGMQMVTPFSNPPGVYYVPQDLADRLLDIDHHDTVMKESRNGYAGNGFVIFFNTKSYAKNGGEDESYLSWTCEDDSRPYCNRKMGLVYGRVSGHVFHCEHFRGPNSCKEKSLLESRRDALPLSQGTR
jgi:predicted glycosyltransferase involved in capsule biosynthesis